MFSQCHVVEKVFQNLPMRLKFRIRYGMKVKIFVARENQYFEIWIFPFNWYVYCLTRAFNLPTGAFNLATHAFSLLTCGLELVTRGFELVTRRFKLVTRALFFHVGNCLMVMESKPWTMYWFSQGQKKEHLNQMREIQFRETSADTERIKYNTKESKPEVQKHWLAQSQKKSQLNPVEQQDSATLLLKSSKSLLQMHEIENYCKQTWETKSDISKYWAIWVLQLFINQAVTL